MEFGGKLSKEEFWARRDEESRRLQARTSGEELYGVASWPGELIVAQWELENDRFSYASLAHGAPNESPYVEVQNFAGDSKARTVERRLTRTLHPDFDASTPVQAHLSVQGREEPCEVWRFENQWVAFTGGTRPLIVVGRDVEPETLDLVRVDIAPYLVGAGAWLMRICGDKLE